MGLEKIGINVGKEIIALAITGKGLLATRPVKVNIKGLKYASHLEKDTVNLQKRNRAYRVQFFAPTI